MSVFIEAAAMRIRIVPLYFVSALFIGAATMPKFPTLSMNVGVHEVTIVFGSPRVTPSVTGAAYSADEVLEYTKTLPDGTHTTQRSVIGHVFRDSQSRTRAEQALKAAPIWTTEIFDPVEGFAYVLDEQKKIVHRMAIRPSQPQPVATRQGAALPQTTTEKLGTQTIAGVIAEGTRTKTTGPTGADGHSTTFTVETWDSPDLEVTVLTRSSNGYTDRLTNLSRVEPDPMQFQPPAYYTVGDEKDSFTMTVKLR